VTRHYLAEQGPGVRHFDATLPPDRLLDAALAELRAVRPDLIPVR
jgi:hypothetical protein